MLAVWLTKWSPIERDSLKDQVVVCAFIIATIGLLLWAMLRPWATRWVEQARLGMRGYQSVPP